MKKQVFYFLWRIGASIGLVFLWMYLFNVGLGFANASNDFLVMLGYLIATAVTIIGLVAMVAIWENEFKKLFHKEEKK